MLWVVMSMLVASGPTLGARAPVAVHVIDAPTPRVGSALLASAARTLEPITNLEVVSPSSLGATPAGLERCQRAETIVCWVLEARPDYKKLEGDAVFDRPMTEHTAELDRRGERYARYVVLVTVVADPNGPTRLTTLFIDANRALEIYHTASRNEEDWLDRVQSEIFEQAVTTELGAVQVNDPSTLDRHFRALWEGRRWQFEERRQWRPNGRVRLLGTVDGLTVVIDAQDAGTTVAGSTELRDVAVGAHRIALVDRTGRYGTFETDLVVVESATATAAVSLLSGEDNETAARAGIAWTGVGLAAVGIGLVTAAVTVKGSVVDLEGRHFVTFGELGRSDDAFPGPPRGPLVAPLGYSLIATGAVWSLGTWLVGDDWEVPWWQLFAGLGVGAASYAISALAN